MGSNWPQRSQEGLKKKKKSHILIWSWHCRLHLASTSLTARFRCDRLIYSTQHTHIFPLQTCRVPSPDERWLRWHRLRKYIGLPPVCQIGILFLTSMCFCVVVFLTLEVHQTKVKENKICDLIRVILALAWRLGYKLFSLSCIRWFDNQGWSNDRRRQGASWVM